MKEMIYKEDAIEAIDSIHDKPNSWLDMASDKILKLDPVKSVREFISIIITQDIDGKTYYEIKYIEDDEEHVGYSSYSIDVISHYLRTYFQFGNSEDSYRPYPKYEPIEVQEPFYYSGIPKPCRMCSNHPSNGGSGICHCTLGVTTVW